MPIGFAPHRPLDGRLIAVYRSAVVQLMEAVNAIERLVLRSRSNVSVPAAIGVRQVLTILDAVDGEGTTFRDTLAELDRQTTPPLWDSDIWSSVWSSMRRHGRRCYRRSSSRGHTAHRHRPDRGATGPRVARIRRGERHAVRP